MQFPVEPVTKGLAETLHGSMAPLQGYSPCWTTWALSLSSTTVSGSQAEHKAHLGRGSSLLALIFGWYFWEVEGRGEVGAVGQTHAQG